MSDLKKTDQDFTKVVVIERNNFDFLFDVLTKRGYHVIGPTLNEGAIIYDTIRNSNDLPLGWIDEQNSGKYRLLKQGNQALFGFNSTPQSWKPFLHKPRARLWQSKRDGNKFTIIPEAPENRKFAFLCVRSCDLYAISILDKVFIDSPFSDSQYRFQRSDIFIAAVNCTHAGGTCFCLSMNTGPEVTEGYDIVMTEVVENDRHYFVVSAGTPKGWEILHDIPYTEANTHDIETAARLVDKTKTEMGRAIDTTGIKQMLYNNSESPRWQEIARRCLTCANCTMVCPTCFCSTIEDVTDLTGDEAERWRKWDSCFTMDFSYIHGGSIRPSVFSRYRQWLTHKFAAWQDQFGTFGCVGCGRCITWCPVGIDVTEEINSIKNSEQNNPSNILIKENR
ncbi:MAG: 4Fe-4S dicluster domain-containing protein [Bacteroidota bacterium]|nr:4Fe-4S dicluster domain-containing protein [Bacteroidota bacterium]